MKTPSAIHCLPWVLAIAVPTASADLFITNFDSPRTSAAVAEGVWRNVNSATDLEISVSLTQTGAVINGESDDDPSITDDTFRWFDDPFTGSDLFDSDTVEQFQGDYMLIEVVGGANVPVVIEFNAQVVDPILHFTDVDTQTTLVFEKATPVKLAGLGNMVVAGNTVTTSGVPTPLLFGSTEETLGSVRFSGTFTRLEFSIVNDGSDPVNDEDRTGFVVTTETEPVAVGMKPTPVLAVGVDGDDVMLDWGGAGVVDAVQMLDGAMQWVPVPGANPGSEGSFTGSRMSLGPTAIFRLEYTP